MKRIDLTASMSAYMWAMTLLCRQIAIRYEKAKMSWDCTDVIEDISCGLFKTMVAMPSNLDDLEKRPAYLADQHPNPHLRLILDSASEIEHKAKCGARDYRHYIGKCPVCEDNPILFVNFFDFDVMSPLLFEYVLAYTKAPLMEGFGNWLRIPSKYVVRYEYVIGGTEQQ